MKQFNLTEYLKNPSRKVVTRKGYPATIISTTFHQENYPVVAEVCFSSYDKKQSYSFTANGSFLDSSEDPRDLFFAPEKYEGWINVYREKDNGGTLSFKDNEVSLEDVNSLIRICKINLILE